MRKPACVYVKSEMRQMVAGCALALAAVFFAAVIPTKS